MWTHWKHGVAPTKRHAECETMRCIRCRNSFTRRSLLVLHYLSTYRYEERKRRQRLSDREREGESERERERERETETQTERERERETDTCIHIYIYIHGHTYIMDIHTSIYTYHVRANDGDLPIRGAAQGYLLS